jgi:hypothetical protein
MPGSIRELHVIEACHCSMIFRIIFQGEYQFFRALKKSNPPLALFGIMAAYNVTYGPLDACGCH